MTLSLPLIFILAVQDIPRELAWFEAVKITNVDLKEEMVTVLIKEDTEVRMKVTLDTNVHWKGQKKRLSINDLQKMVKPNIFTTLVVYYDRRDEPPKAGGRVIPVEVVLSQPE